MRDPARYPSHLAVCTHRPVITPISEVFALLTSRITETVTSAKTECPEETSLLFVHSEENPTGAGILYNCPVLLEVPLHIHIRNCLIFTELF